MAQASWTKNKNAESLEVKSGNGRLKFVIGGIVLAIAVGFLAFNAMSGNTQLYKTVNEFYAEQTRLLGRDLRVSGYVIGDSIQFTQIDAANSRLEFDIVDDLANPGQTLRVVVLNEPMPDLLQHEAQALVEGHANEDGFFMANPGGLMLKCPTRYEEAEAHPEGV